MLKMIKSGSAKFASAMQKRIPLMAMLVIAGICAAALLFHSVNIYTVTDGEKTKTIHTLSSDVDFAINSAGFESSKYKVLSCDFSGNKANVTLAYTFPVYITVGDETVEVNTTKATVGEILSNAGYTVDEFDMVQPAADTLVIDTLYIDYTDINYVSGSYTEVIPYTLKTVYSSRYDEGTKTVKAGTDGLQQINYTAKVVNGVTVETVIDSTITLSEAVSGTQTIGTKKPKAAVITSDQVKSISTLKPASPIELDANGNPINFTKHITVQATAYTYTGNNCSTGVAPQPGYIAVNPNVIPYGTKMYIKSSDGTYIYGYAVAADTGGFINSRPNNVDLFFTSQAACNAFGRRNVEIYIIG